MKKLFVSIFAIAAITFSATAQEKKEMKHDGSGMHNNAEGKKTDMMNELNLSEDQKAQMTLNHDNYRKQLNALKQNQSLTVKELNDKKDALHKEQEAKMAALLTPEQKRKMAEVKAQRDIKEKEHYEKKMEGMKSKLSLSDDQVSKLKSLHENIYGQMRTVRADQSLNKDAKREKLTQLRNEATEKRKSILSADQLQKMEDSKKDHKEKKPSKK